MRNFATQTYTAYSSYFGTAKPSVWAKKAKAFGHRAVAITDRHTMAGVLQIEQAAREVGIKAIHGYDMYLYESNSKDESNKCLGRVIVYSQNMEGYYNMVAINNFAGKRVDDGGGFYFRPRMNVDKLIELSKGLILVIPEAGGGDLFEAITKPRSKLFQIVSQLSSVFKDRFYVGVNSQITSELEAVKFPMIPSQDVRSLLKKDIVAAQALLDLDDGHVTTNIINGKNPSSLDMISDDVDTRLLDNLDIFFNSIEDKFFKIKDYKIPASLGGDFRSILLAAAIKGFRKKLCSDLPADMTYEKLFEPETLAWLDTKYSQTLEISNHPNKHRDSLKNYALRLKEEVEIIDDLDKQGYFYPLFRGFEASDAAGFERGPGRGSGAGSLYLYLLNFTMVDPIPNDLLFFRFINPSRKLDPPDVDSDLSEEGRNFLLDFWRKEYGADCVCKIGTYGRLKIKSAIGAIARSKGYGILDNDGKIVSYEPHILNKILDVHVTATSRGQDELDEMLEDERFAEFFEKHEKWFVEYVMPILESVKSESIHAAGAVITDKPYEQVLPMNYRDKAEGVTTQYEMDAIDLAGYLKYDMLVLTAVTLIEDVKRLVKENHNIELPSIEHIDLADPLMIDIFNKVKTRGVFQYNTRSQMRFGRVLKPTKMDHLVAAIALIRPGPISAGMPDDFVARVNGLAEVSYRFPETKDILEKTYGLMIYQEQTMQLAMQIASFTGVEAEGLRKACGKKKIEEMKKWEATFVERALANGHKEVLVRELWAEIEATAAYQFNLSHSYAYTLISAYQGWIKARYPTEYWTATLLNAKKNTKNGNSVYDLKAEAEREGIIFLFPSVEGFATEFSVASEGKIYWPLNVIKGVGEKALEVLSDMGHRHHFEDMQHFVDVAISKHPVSKRQTVTAGVVKPLVKAGFFNCWMKPWEAMKEYNRLVSIAKKEKEKDMDYEMAREDIVYWHTLRNQSYGCQVDKWKNIAPFSPEIKSYYPDELINLREGCKILIGGEVKDVILKKTKKGDTYASIRIADGAEFYYVNAWSSWWSDINLDKTRTRPRAGDIIEIVVKKTTFNGYAQLSIGDEGEYCRIVARPSKGE